MTNLTFIKTMTVLSFHGQTVLTEAILVEYNFQYLPSTWLIIWVVKELHVCQST